MKSWLILRTLSVINQWELWTIKGVNLSESCSNSTSFTSLMSFLNDIPLTPFMPVILWELLIQDNCHLLNKGTPCWNQLSSMTKTRQNECLKKFWICDIQNQIIAFSTKFTELTVTLILSNITQMIMSSEMYWKLYRNIMCVILTN